MSAGFVWSLAINSSVSLAVIKTKSVFLLPGSFSVSVMASCVACYCSRRNALFRPLFLVVERAPAGDLVMCPILVASLAIINLLIAA